MIETKRYSHIIDKSFGGFVHCPACHTLVPVEDRFCLECGQYVNYKRNLEVLANWYIDLFNFAILDIQDGLVNYWFRFRYSEEQSRLGRRYENYYSLENGRDVIPDQYTSSGMRYYKAGAFVIYTQAGGQTFNYGLLDKEGNEVISPVCDDIQDIDSKGRFIVKHQGKVGVVNIVNQNIIPIIYDSIKRASISYEDYFIVEKDGLFGILDNRNEIIVPIEFEAIGEFSYEPIAVCKNKKWGFYDSSSGTLVIPFKFDKANSFYGIFARVQLGDDAFFIDEMGFPILPEWRREKEVIENGRVVIRSDKGDIIQRKVFEPANEKNGIKRYEIDGKYGAINPDGVFVIPPEYDELYILEGGLCPARKGDIYGNNWGVLSCEGNCIIPFDYCQTWVDDGIIRIRGHNERGSIRVGYIDRFGQTVVPLEHYSLSHFKEGLCWSDDYESRSGCRIMDKFGNYVEYRPVVVDGHYKERPFSLLPF